MKIKKRQPPVDFQSVTGELPARTDDAVAADRQSDSLPTHADTAAEFDIPSAAETAADETLFEPPPLHEAAAHSKAFSPYATRQDSFAPPPPEPARQEPLTFGPLRSEHSVEPTPEPEPGPAPVAASFQPPATRPELGAVDAVATPPAWPIYAAATIVSVLWACAPLAFALGYRAGVSPLQDDAFAIMVFALLAIGPAALVWIGAFMIRQGQKLAAETRRAKLLADEMISPAVAAGVRAGDVVNSVREEIARASQAADEARDTLLALRQVLAQESEQLVQSAASSARTAQTLAKTLGQERTEMASLAVSLDTQAAAVADAIAQQAKMVAEASDLAETQLREAEATLAARAADLAAAAGEASDAARGASEDLTRHIARLETAGAGVVEQIAAVQTGLTEQRAGLVTVAHALRADQEAFAAEAESQSAQLAEFISQARLSAVEMGDRATKGGEALRQMILEAAEQFRDLADSARAERDEFGQSTLHALEQVSAAAAQERARLEDQTRAVIYDLARAAEETRNAAERHAETARAQVDQLSEAAFHAGQKANSVFEARLAEARDLIERSAQLVEQAGNATARKLDEGTRSARATLDELAALMAEIEDRAARLPATARGQAEQVRQAVSESIDELMEHARRTADETQAIDAAFQERVRRNYDMLSEAVRLMGSAAGTTGGTTPPPAPAPLAPPLAMSLRERLTPPSFRAGARMTRPAAPPPPEPASEAQADEDASRRAGLRPRLKLTPTASDEEFSSLFESAGGRTPEPAPAETDAADGWTWKDLLSQMDDDAAPTPAPAAASSMASSRSVEDSGADAALAREIATLGIDPAALLPRSRIDEIAAAIQTRDVEGAREVVRKLAPAATRRLARRLFTDESLKRQVGPYLRRYAGLLETAADRDPGGFEVAALLGSDAGRAYLLFDAAGGDLV